MSQHIDGYRVIIIWYGMRIAGWDYCKSSVVWGWVIRKEEACSPLHGLVLRKVEALGDDRVRTPVRPTIFQQDADVTRPEHRLFDRHFEAGQCGLCMSSILVDLVRDFADPETREARGELGWALSGALFDICRIFSDMRVRTTASYKMAANEYSIMWQSI